MSFFSLVSKLFNPSESYRNEVVENKDDNVVSKMEEKIISLVSNIKKQADEIETMVCQYQQQVTKYAELEKKCSELEDKLENELLIKKIIKDRFLKEPDMTTVYEGFNLMTINQFKNIIPKMDLDKFTDLTTKEKYYNATMYMLVRKFNNDERYGGDEFVDYVINNESLTVSVRKYLQSEENSVKVRTELMDFYTLIQIY